jgi:K+ transporter
MACQFAYCSESLTSNTIIASNHVLNFKFDHFYFACALSYQNGYACIEYTFFPFFPDIFTLIGSEAMFADLGHFNPRSIQVIFMIFGLSFKIAIPFQPVFIFSPLCYFGNR